MFQSIFFKIYAAVFFELERGGQNPPQVIKVSKKHKSDKYLFYHPNV